MEFYQKRIREIIVEHSEMDKLELDDQATLIGDMQFDSIKIINLMVALEKEFRIEFEDMELFVEKFDQVGSFVEYVMACIKNAKINYLKRLWLRNLIMKREVVL